MNIDEIVIYNINKLMAERNLSQAQLARDAKISVHNLNRLMKGRRSIIKANVLPSIALVLGVEIKDLTTSPNHEKEKEASLRLAHEFAKSVEERRQKRIDFLAWELNLDQNNPNDLKIMEDIMPLLPHLRKIPSDILSLLSRQDELYFNSLRKTLNLMEDKKGKTKKSSSEG